MKKKTLTTIRVKKAKNLQAMLENLKTLYEELSRKSYLFSAFATIRLEIHSLSSFPIQGYCLILSLYDAHMLQ